MRRVPPALARLVALLVALACGREPSTTVGVETRLVRALAIEPVFPPAYQVSGGVVFDRVRVVLRHSDGSLALDTVVNFPAGASSVSVVLSVRLLPGTSGSGEPVSVNMGYVNAAGDTVFRGRATVNVAPTAPGAPPPPPVEIPVTYSGTGANAARVAISPKALNLFAGDGVTFSAQAFDASGAALPNTPVVFTTSDASIVQINTSGSGTAGTRRGSATVTAQLLTGQTDAATVTVQLRASTLSLIGGSGQTAEAGKSVPLPIVVRVSASDGIGVSGFPVSFSAANGGSVAPATVLTDASGAASSVWTLGSTPGPQSATASAAGVAASPVTFSATATPKAAVRLSFAPGAPTTVQAFSAFALTVRAQDTDGNTVPTFNGPIALALGANPGAATLGGAVTAVAAAGVATFSNLTIDRVAVGYTIVASSGTLTAATTAPITVQAGAASRLTFTTGPASVTAGQTLPPVVLTATDQGGNLANGFSGAISLALGNNTTGAALGGTTTLNAAAGVATFPDLMVNRPGTGYTLIASGPGFPQAISGPFNVTAGAAARCVAFGGNQVFAPGAPPFTVGVLVTDASGNPIPGASVTASVVTGGILPPAGVTDAGGRATFTWTLGPTLGTQTASFGCRGVAAGATASVTIETLFGANGQAGSVFRLHPTTGAVLNTWSPGIGPISAMATDPTTGTIYLGTGAGLPTIYRFDPVLGTATFVGNTGLGFAAVSGLTFRSDGTLYASVNIARDGGSGGDHLAIVNKATGVATIVGPYGLCTGVVLPSVGGGSCTIEGIEGIVFDRSGVLWGAHTVRGVAGAPGLYQINPVTGAATFVVNPVSGTGVPASGGIVSLTMDRAGNMFGGTARAISSTDGGYLVSLNAAAGRFALISQVTATMSLSAITVVP
jgi:hypothetical protein